MTIFQQPIVIVSIIVIVSSPMSGVCVCAQTERLATRRKAVCSFNAAALASQLTANQASTAEARTYKAKETKQAKRVALEQTTTSKRRSAAHLTSSNKSPRRETKRSETSAAQHLRAKRHCASLPAALKVADALFAEVQLVADAERAIWLTGARCASGGARQ